MGNALQRAFWDWGEAGGMTARKTRAQRDLERATELLRKPGARLMMMHTKNPAEYRWFIVPGGPVETRIAEKIIDRPDVYGCADGLFPGRDQTWKFA